MVGDWNYTIIFLPVLLIIKLMKVVVKNIA